MQSGFFTGFLAFMLLAAGACREPDNVSLRGVRPGRVARIELQVAPRAELRIETQRRSGSRIVLHLWDPARKLELARSAGSSWGWLSPDASLSYRNTGTSPRKLWLIAHAAAADGHAAVDLVRDGRPWLHGLDVAGAVLSVAHGTGYRYLAAAEPAGPARAAFYALASNGRLLAISDSGGRTGLPRLSGNDFVRTLVVSAEPARGGLHVLVDDPDDADHDGLGRKLETALGTCDAPNDELCRHGLLASYYRALPNATRDTDRDGLPDGDEVLGVAGAPGLDLPRWGADPRHKDVFVEVDRHTRAEHDSLNEDDYAQVAALFARGSARELRNPDGLPGVHMHFDVGFAPASPAHATLLGDWGGSNVVALRDYRKGRDTDFAASRHGYFRYALVSRQGTGQARGDAFTINRDYHRVQVFAHELAHTLGLQHEGHPSWGKANCKPSYFSIMNYVFQNRADIGFARRAARALDPTRVFESQGLGSQSALYLHDSPFELDVQADGATRGVDWNRDGIISKEPVRAGLLFATYKSCGASTVARTTLGKEDVAAETPVLVHRADRLYALWIDSHGGLVLRSGKVSGPDAHGSCPLGDGDRDPCMLWDPPRAVAGAHDLRHVAALSASSTQTVLAYVHDDGSLYVAQLEGTPDKPELVDERVLAGVTTRDAPTLARMRVDESRYGVSDVISVFVRAADGRFVQVSARAASGPWVTRPVLDASGASLEGALAPTVLELGTGELCGVFPDRERFVRFACYDRSRDAWADLTARAFYEALGPQVGGPVGLAYHRYRAADGTPLAGDDSRGAVYMTFTEAAPGTVEPPDNPNLYVSEWLSAEHGAFEQLDFRWRGTLDSQWTHVAAASTVTLYEDAQLSALKALMTQRDGDGVRVDFLPLADGAFAASLGGGSDFEVMERGICSVIRGDASCGDRSTGAY